MNCEKCHHQLKAVSLAQIAAGGAYFERSPSLLFVWTPLPWETTAQQKLFLELWCWYFGHRFISAFHSWLFHSSYWPCWKLAEIVFQNLSWQTKICIQLAYFPAISATLKVVFLSSTWTNLEFRQQKNQLSSIFHFSSSPVSMMIFECCGTQCWKFPSTFGCSWCTLWLELIRFFFRDPFSVLSFVHCSTWMAHLFLQSWLKLLLASLGFSIWQIIFS